MKPVEFIKNSIKRNALYFFIFHCFIFSFAFAQLSDAEQQYVRGMLAVKVNTLRAEQGLHALEFDLYLKDAAIFHSNYMARYDKLQHEEHFE
ncbi:MAG: CAP domain-containing protein, partial [Bacteroidia bacterium]